MDRNADFSHSRLALEVRVLTEIWAIKIQIPALPTECFGVEHHALVIEYSLAKKQSLI